MVRLLVAVGLALCVAGCFGGGGEEDDGTLDPAALEQTATRASFHVRVPLAWQGNYRLLNVGQVTGPQGHSMVSFDPRPATE